MKDLLAQGLKGQEFRIRGVGLGSCCVLRMILCKKAHKDLPMNPVQTLGA